MMASLSAMSPSTMRWMMLLCSSSDKFLWDTRGVLNLVAGDGSTPWSHAWLSISSSDARLFGSLCSIRFIRLWRRGREDEDVVFLKNLTFFLTCELCHGLTSDFLKPRISSRLVQYLGKCSKTSRSLSHISLRSHISLVKILNCLRFS